MILQVIDRSKAREGSGWIARERVDISRSCVPYRAVEDGRSGSHAVWPGRRKGCIGRESAEDVKIFLRSESTANEHVTCHTI